MLYQLRTSFVLLVMLLIAAPSWAAFEVPKLTGRVVDQANVIDANTEQRINQLLAGHEKATTNQVVVVTLADLQGYSIEQAGLDMGRAWGIGQKDTNNGVLLVLAQAERKVRIEVGYGLEGELTDAISASIVHQIMLPQFKQGNLSAGLYLGAEATVAALGGAYVAPRATSNKSKVNQRELTFVEKILFALGFLAVVVLSIVSPTFRTFLFFMLISGMRGGRGGSGGGGFSGGGGSFGGGGASGGW